MLTFIGSSTVYQVFWIFFIYFGMASTHGPVTVPTKCDYMKTVPGFCCFPDTVSCRNANGGLWLASESVCDEGIARESLQCLGVRTSVWC